MWDSADSSGALSGQIQTLELVDYATVGSRPLKQAFMAAEVGGWLSAIGHR